MKKGVFLLLLVGLFATSAFAQDKDLYIYQVDPLEKVLKDRQYFKDEVDTIRAARGETASVQLVIKAKNELQNFSAKVIQVSSGSSNIPGAETGWVGYVKVGRKYEHPSKDLLRSESDYFPDPIVTDTTVNLLQNEVQPLWITVPVPRNTVPGIYRGKVELSGYAGNKKRIWQREFFIKVYSVTISTTSLLISNWSDHHSQHALKLLNNGNPVEHFSDLYWDIVKKEAKMVASHGENVYRIYPVWSTQFKLENGKYEFDFSRFDKELELFEAAGNLARIEGGHLAWRYAGWNDPFYVEVPLEANEETNKLPTYVVPFKQENSLRRVLLPISDQRAQNFLNQFLPGLRDHLAKKGWLNKYIQHIADEPVPENAESYRQISNYVKKHLPNTQIIDAVLTSKELAGTIDIWVPILDVLHRDINFYKDLQSKGKELWFYTCLNPQGNYANRFIELPLIQTRFLHWINYKYNAVGYLHWGLNYWGGSSPFEGDASRDIMLPAGDNWIIYPGYRKFYSSIRFEAMRDGIHDYELLKMLEKKDPQKAKEYANIFIRNFNEYDSNVTYFRYVRKAILEQLSR